jgi:hypothetical protein
LAGEIIKIHWGAVGEHTWKGARGRLHAFWPEPVNHDACFKKAGFELFSDDLDHEGWRAVLERTIEAISRFGALSVTSEQMTIARLFGLARKKQDSASPTELLEWACREDSIDPTCLEAGNPTRALAMTSDGHWIIWIWLADELASQWPAVLASVAGNTPTTETTLAWNVLLPAPLGGR